MELKPCKLCKAMPRINAADGDVTCSNTESCYYWESWYKPEDWNLIMAPVVGEDKVTALLEAVNAVRMAGLKMSNLCYNASQWADKVPADLRKSMGQCYAEWDAVMPKLRATLSAFPVAATEQKKEGSTP